VSSCVDAIFNCSEKKVVIVDSSNLGHELPISWNCVISNPSWFSKIHVKSTSQKSLKFLYGRIIV